MSVLFGHGAFIKFGEETSWGTGVTPTISNRINSITMSKTQERDRKANLSVPASGMLGEVFDGFLIAEGSMEIPIYYQGQGLWFKLAFGKVTTTGGGPYTHSFEPEIDLESATLQVQRGSGITEQMEEFQGVKVSQLQVSCEAGGEMTASLDLIGKTSSTRAANITSSFGTGTSVLHFQAGQFTFNGAGYNARSMTFTLNNNLERRNVLGSKLTAEQAVADVRECTLEVTLDILENSLHNAFIAGTQSDASITFTSGTDSITFTVTNALITSFSDPVNGFGRVEQTMTFTGLADNSNVGGKIVLVNDDATGIAN